MTDAAGAWREILCVQEERIVANDNTLSWNAMRLQIPESRLRPHFVKASVRVHEYPDGTLSVFLGPHLLARYTAEGKETVSAPAALSRPSCSRIKSGTAVKAKPFGRPRRAAGLDRSCARCPAKAAGRDGETGFKPNKETGRCPKGGDSSLTFDTKSLRQAAAILLRR